MLFSSIPFLYYFLPAVLILYFLAPWKLKNAVLLFSSLFFYGWGEPKLLALMAFTIVLFYGCGLAIGRAEAMIETGRTKILHATLRDEYYYDLVLATYDPPIGVGGVIENISACPDFEFAGNTINRVVTRGVLVTTRGKVRIENNKFLNFIT